jgi:hypothetical protein
MSLSRSGLVTALALCAIVNGFAACGRANDFPKLEGPYLGQQPPDTTPEIFAEGIYSPGENLNSVFSPDGNEFYFVTWDADDRLDVWWMRQVSGVWTPPDRVPFNSEYKDGDVCLSHDNQRLFWRSWRPLPGQERPEEHSYIWFVTRSENGSWGSPQPVKAGGAYLQAGYPAITKEGTLYYPYHAEGNVGEADIYRSVWVNGAFGAPEHLGRTVNTPYDEGDMCVSPNGRFLVVAEWDRPDNVGGTGSDLYISFKRKDGTWTKLINLGPTINSPLSDNCPTLSPDGRYFFFQRYDGKRSDTWWVDAAVLQDVRPAGLE